jgi:hypothetical protein
MKNGITTTVNGLKPWSMDPWRSLRLCERSDWNKAIQTNAFGAADL